jgi:hypothetical protein
MADYHKLLATPTEGRTWYPPADVPAIELLSRKEYAVHTVIAFHDLRPHDLKPHFRRSKLGLPDIEHSPGNMQTETCTGLPAQTLQCNKVAIDKWNAPRGQYLMQVNPQDNNTAKILVTIKKMVNQHPCVMSYHAGSDSCPQYRTRANHIHITLFPHQYFPNTGVWTAIQKLKRLNTIEGIYCKQQKVRDVEEILNYQLKAPKVFLGTNNNLLLQTILNLDGHTLG